MVGLTVPAIHMLRVIPETPMSSAIQGMLWSESSTNRLRSLKDLLRVRVDPIFHGRANYGCVTTVGNRVAPARILVGPSLRSAGHCSKVNTRRRRHFGTKAMRDLKSLGDQSAHCR